MIASKDFSSITEFKCENLILHKADNHPEDSTWLLLVCHVFTNNGKLGISSVLALAVQLCPCSEEPDLVLCEKMVCGNF